MPTDQSPAPEPSSRPPMPPSVRVAVIVMGIMAALLLMSAGLSWYTFDAVVDRIVEQGNDVDREQARTVVLQNLLVYGLMGLLVALSAVFLPRRQPWARWVGLATTAAIALLTAAPRAVDRRGREPAGRDDRRLGAEAAHPRLTGGRRRSDDRRRPVDQP